ncbi:hypothetical protein [Ulvibacterium sp.]|uniref:hypothetical protein n=1 Tax=Ulvibacterium sp. TaxID=2665914 RepID=UPI003CC5982D
MTKGLFSASASKAFTARKATIFLTAFHSSESVPAVFPFFRFKQGQSYKIAKMDGLTNK